VNKYERDALAHARSIWFRVGIACLVITACILLLGGCNSTPQETGCSTLKCIKAQERHRAFLDCLRSNPSQRKAGRGRVLPGGLEWHEYCARVAR
jgi:hypothetical protein